MIPISAVEGGKLTVRDMDYPDAGEYMCSSMNEHDSFNATITVRVKGQSVSVPHKLLHYIFYSPFPNVYNDIVWCADCILVLF